MHVLRAITELQVCRDCGETFGTDEAKRCQHCRSYICPYCKRCLCVFSEHIFAEDAWDNPYVKKQNRQKV